MVRRKKRCLSVWYMAWRSAKGQTNSHMVGRGALEKDKESLNYQKKKASLDPASVRMKETGNKMETCTRQADPTEPYNSF